MGTPSTSTVRDTRLDVARGIAIAGVVIVHVYRGLYAAGMIDLSTTVMVDRLVTPWCLSVFVFVSGTLVPRGVHRRGIPSYVRDRVARLGVVFVIWTLLQGGAQLLASQAVNTPTSPLAVLSLWRPLGQLWYLPFLMLATIVFIPLQPWIRQRAPWILTATAIISVVFWGYDGGYIGTQGLGLLFFFIAGMAIGTERLLSMLDRITPAVGAVVGISVTVLGSVAAVLTDATSSTVFWAERTVTTTAVGIVLALLTSAAMILVGHGLRGASWLAFLGRRSLDIYLAHIVMASGTRIVLSQLGVTSIWVFVVVGTAVGVLGSVLAGTVARKIRLGWVFDGPSWITGTAKTPKQEAPRRSDGG